MGWRTEETAVDQVGHSMIGEITSIRGQCRMGHKAGDKFELSIYDSNGLCGRLYHAAYPCLCTLQFGGKYPAMWCIDETTPVGEESDEEVIECPDLANCVRLKLHRERRSE